LNNITEGIKNIIEERDMYKNLYLELSENLENSLNPSPKVFEKSQETKPKKKSLFSKIFN
jgi:hypothetical protein